MMNWHKQMQNYKLNDRLMNHIRAVLTSYKTELYVVVQNHLDTS